MGSNTGQEGVGNTIVFDGYNFYGLSIQVRGRLFSFQASTVQADVRTSGYTTLAGPAAPDFASAVPMGQLTVMNVSTEGEVEIKSVGFSFDIANFIGYMEYADREVEGTLKGLFPNQEGWYVTFGYRVGRFLPHITVASSDDDPAGTPLVGALQGETQDSIALGLRYEINDSAALKLEYKSIELDNTTFSNGHFTADANNAFIVEDEATIISVVMDVIF
jgi:hypothetical protein